MYDNEDWVLVIESIQGDKIKRVKIYTTEEIFNSYKIGEHYTFNNKDRTEDRVVKRRATDVSSNRESKYVR
jgi:hypothetical protein